MSLFWTEGERISSTAKTDKCIVLDLDETLVYSQEDMDLLDKLNILTSVDAMELRSRVYRMTLDDVVTKPGEGDAYDLWGVKRPHLTEFLVFCFSYFKIVAVWSAGRRRYVEAIVREIFRDIRKPHVVFCYDDIAEGPKGFYKPLQKMRKSSAILARYMTKKNTFAIDDREDTFDDNPKNGILITPYMPDLTIEGMMEDDPTLLQLMYWFSQPHVMKADDVTKLNKEDIFTTTVKEYRAKRKRS